MANLPRHCEEQSDEASQKTVEPRLRFPEFRGEEGWEMRILGEQGEFLSSLTGKSAQHFGVGSAKFITYMNVFSNTFTDMTSLGTVDIAEDESQNTVACGDILFTVSSETPEEAGMSSVVLQEISNCYLNSFCTLFRFAKEKRPNPHFLGYLMRQPLVRSYFGERAQGSTRFNLSKTVFRELSFAVPTTAEQQKIADCLTSLDEVIAAQGQKVETLKTYKRGLMQQLFPREGETIPRLRFPEFHDAPEWEEVPLGELFDTKSGGTPDRAKKEYWSGSIPWVTTSLVDFNIITNAEEFISKSGLENSSAKIFPRNTILIAMYGQGKTRGKIALLGISATTNQACAAILPRSDIAPFFVFTNLCGRYDEIRALSNSGGQENLSQDLIRQLPFRYPKDTEEQSKIADCLSTIDSRITAESEKFDALKTHKKSLMQQLFPTLNLENS